MRKTGLIAILSIVFMTGAGCPSAVIPKMERPISLFAGCPKFKGICKYSKSQVEAKFAPTLPSVASGDLNEWIEQNIDGGMKVRILPAEAKSFGGYTAIPNQDLGVLLNYIDTLKRMVGK
jgi:hypothetical protein